MYISMTRHFEVPDKGVRLVLIDQNGDLQVWPHGIGEGPVLIMSRDDWARLSNEVRLAYIAHEGKLIAGE